MFSTKVRVWSAPILPSKSTVSSALIAGALMCSLSISSAVAATFSLSSGGTAGTLPASFNPTGIAAINADGITVGTAITIFSGTGNTGGLLLSPNTDVSLTFTFMGKEAGYTNQLLTGSTVLLSNNAAPGTASGPIAFNAGTNPGVVPFSFLAVTPGNLSAVNGGSIASGLQIAFAKISDSIFYAFFDDGGAGPDKDFDDMVVRITASDVIRTNQGSTPIPAALPLFATGLGGLGLLGWRRKKRTA